MLQRLLRDVLRKLVQLNCSRTGAAMSNPVLLLAAFLVVLLIKTYTQGGNECRVHTRCNNDGVRLLTKHKVAAAEQFPVNASHCLAALIVDNISTLIIPASFHLKSHCFTATISESGSGLGAEH